MQKHRKFIGDKRFYLMVLGVAMPIMIQNGITNFVSQIGRASCRERVYRLV